MLPWQYSQDDVQETLEYYPGQEAQALQTLDDFYHNSYKIAGITVFAIYIAFFALTVGNGIMLALLKTCPSLRRSRAVNWVRAQVFKSPIASVAHHEAFHPLGKYFLSLRLPLRFEFIVVVVLVFANVLPLAGLYRLTPSDVSVYWPGPTSHRDQMARYLADRSALLAIGQVPLVILMAGRNSPIAAISGLDFNSLMLWHRWIARMTWLQVNVHSFAYTAIGIQTGYIKEDFAEAYWRWGCVATAMWWGLTILALTELRKRAYEVWLVGHIVFAVLGLVGTYFHIALLEYTGFYPYVILTYVSAAIWALDRVIRVARRVWVSFHTVKAGQGLMASASVEAFPDITRLQIDVPAACLTFLGESGTDEKETASSTNTSLVKIAPGHSVRLLAPKVEWISDHPFTVCDTTRSSTDPTMGQMTILVRAYGGMTKKLEKLATQAASQDLESHSPVVRTPVVIEGPYGDLHNYLASSDVVLLFAGGIGITFCLPFLSHVALQQPHKQCKLVWNVKSFAHFLPVQDQLLGLVSILRQRGSPAAGALPIAIELHVTEDADEGAIAALNKTDSNSAGSAGPSSPQQDKKSLSERSEKGLSSDLQPWFAVTVKSGRSVNSLTHHVGAGEASGKSLGLAACGPASLCDDIRSEAKQALLGGQWSDVDHVEECFSW